MTFTFLTMANPKWSSASSITDCSHLRNCTFAFHWASTCLWWDDAATTHLYREQSTGIASTYLRKEWLYNRLALCFLAFFSCAWAWNAYDRENKKVCPSGLVSSTLMQAMHITHCSKRAWEQTYTNMMVCKPSTPA